MKKKSSQDSFLLGILLCTTSIVFAETGKLTSGQILSEPNGIVYGMAQNDTLSAVANRFTKTSKNWKAIGKINHIANDRTIPVGTGILIPLKMLPEDNSFATISALHGKVSILSKSGDAIAPIVGTALPEGTMIATGINSFVTLTLKNGTSFSLSPSSNLELTTLRITPYVNQPRTALTLKKGRINSTVTPLQHPRRQYEIRTPMAVAGVRGTQFRVDFDGTKSTSEVLKGTVNVTALQAMKTKHSGAVSSDLHANYGSVVSNTRLSAAIALLDPPTWLNNDNTSIGKLPVHFILSHPDAQALRVVISKDPQGHDNVAEATAKNTPGQANTTVSIHQLEDGHYYVHLSAIDSHGLEGKTQLGELTLKIHPLPPYLIAPNKAQRNIAGDDEGQVRYTWASTGADHAYHLQVASDPTFEHLLFDQSDLHSTEYLQHSLPTGTYYWRVASITNINGQTNQGPYSDQQQFIQLPPQTTPTVTQDENNIQFSWGGEPGQKFILETSTRPDFVPLLLHQEINEPHIQLPRPEAGIYFVRIRAIEADGYEGAFSPPQKFTVITPWRSSYGESWNASGSPVISNY